jgi:hypothetical protein
MQAARDDGGGRHHFTSQLINRAAMRLGLEFWVIEMG